MIVTIRQLAWRYFVRRRTTSRYQEDPSKIESDRPPLLPGEELIGAYENETAEGSTWLWITSRSLCWPREGEWNRVWFDDIVREGYPSKSALDDDNLKLTLRNGRTEEVPVTGRKGRFRDVYNFGMFVNRAAFGRRREGDGRISSEITQVADFLRCLDAEEPYERWRARFGPVAVPVWREVLERYPQHVFVAAWHPDLPVEIVDRLAEWPDERVRMIVAGREDLSPEVIERLQADGSKPVRLALLRNRETPGTVLARLTRDEEAEVAEAARTILHAQTKSVDSDSGSSTAS